LALPLSPHTWYGIIAVFGFAVVVSGFTVAVFDFALITSKWFLQVVVIALGHRGREIGLWREIVDCVEKNPQTSYCALPLYLFLHCGYHSLACKTNPEFFPFMADSMRPRKHPIVLDSPSSPQNRIT